MILRTIWKQKTKDYIIKNKEADVAFRSVLDNIYRTILSRTLTDKELDTIDENLNWELDNIKNILNEDDYSNVVVEVYHIMEWLKTMAVQHEEYETAENLTRLGITGLYDF